MITLHLLPPAWEIPSGSPFCLKLEFYLKLSGLEYRIEYSNDPRKSPKGKLPYMTDGKHTLGDSSFIIKYLKDKYEVDLDQNLTTEEKAISLSMRRLIEEHLYWVCLHARWQEDDSFQLVKKMFFSGLPPILRSFVPKIVRKKLRKSSEGHGIGLHSRKEIYELGSQDIDALSSFLGEKEYFMGATPTTLDTVAIGTLLNIIVPPIESPIKQYTVSKENLMKYCERMKKILSSKAESP